jgi:transposase-like protein
MVMRWTARRKAAVIIAIRNGEISLDEAKSQYGLSDEELAPWMRDYDTHGERRLRSLSVRHLSPQT